MANWTPETDWTLWRRDKFLSPAKNLKTVSRSLAILVTGFVKLFQTLAG